MQNSWLRTTNWSMTSWSDWNTPGLALRIGRWIRSLTAIAPVTTSVPRARRWRGAVQAVRDGLGTAPTTSPSATATQSDDRRGRPRCSRRARARRGLPRYVPVHPPPRSHRAIRGNVAPGVPPVRISSGLISRPIIESPLTVRHRRRQSSMERRRELVCSEPEPGCRISPPALPRAPSIRSLPRHLPWGSDHRRHGPGTLCPASRRRAPREIPCPRRAPVHA